ncbi:MAG: hypothetical protein V7784_19300 [Oceanospirillaceae bacterium]
MKKLAWTIDSIKDLKSVYVAASIASNAPRNNIKIEIEIIDITHKTTLKGVIDVSKYKKIGISISMLCK